MLYSCCRCLCAQGAFACCDHCRSSRGIAKSVFDVSRERFQGWYRELRDFTTRIFVMMAPPYRGGKCARNLSVCHSNCISWAWHGTDPTYDVASLTKYVVDNDLKPAGDAAVFSFFSFAQREQPTYQQVFPCADASHTNQQSSWQATTTTS